MPKRRELFNGFAALVLAGAAATLLNASSASAQDTPAEKL
jgi:hypothetical protein